tara:strand:- start:735 stop:983 length:249 start_codon:yes stop_codon:yes gene_type:complete
MQKKNQKRKINLTEYREEVVATLAALKVDVRNTKETLSEVKSLLREQNGRIRKNEATLGWIKGIGTIFIATYSTLLAWFFNK